MSQTTRSPLVLLLVLAAFEAGCGEARDGQASPSSTRTSVAEEVVAERATTGSEAPVASAAETEGQEDPAANENENEDVTHASPAPPSTSCGEASTASLLAALPAEQRAGLVLDQRHARFQFVILDLDGSADPEAILAIDSLVSELELELGRPRSALFVLRCVAGLWIPLGRLDLFIDEGWDGTLDIRPGIVALRAERLAGVHHDFARIEQLDVRGSYDPRFIARRFLLVHIVDNQIVVALDREVRRETESGPDRSAGETEVRHIVYQNGLPPRIALRIQILSPDGRTRTICRTMLTFDGSTFVSADPTCI